MDLDPELQRLLDRDQIREINERYAVACDAHDNAARAALFASDVDNEKFARFGVGRAAVEKYYDSRLSRPVGSHLHSMSAPQIDFVDGEQAFGVVYCRVLYEAEDGTWAEYSQVLFDEYVKRDGRWYFWVRWPYDLQVLTFEQRRAVPGKPLVEGWVYHRERTEAMRGWSG